MEIIHESTAEVVLQAPRSVLDRFVLYVKLVQGWAKLRRFYLSNFRPKYVARMRAQRRGACVRCGHCCSIMFRCPGLKMGNHCGVYAERPRACMNFPIDHHDLRYLEQTCGFYFVREDAS